MLPGVEVDVHNSWMWSFTCALAIDAPQSIQLELLPTPETRSSIILIFLFNEFSGSVLFIY